MSGESFDLRRVDLNLLLAFDALMAERGVTAAAARMSITQSAARITSSSCSTTNTELPPAFSRANARSSASVSAGCRPAEGSSST